MLCKSCGCSDLVACPDGCFWIEPDLCSACAPLDHTGWVNEDWDIDDEEWDDEDWTEEDEDAWEMIQFEKRHRDL